MVDKFVDSAFSDSARRTSFATYMRHAQRVRTMLFPIRLARLH
jgi:hypothetical protein